MNTINEEKMSVREELTDIVKEIVEESNRNPTELFLIEIDGRRMPFWTFRILFKIMEYFVAHGVPINFQDVVMIDRQSAGHTDYIHQVISNAMLLLSSKIE